MDSLFLRDQLRALLASPPLARVARNQDHVTEAADSDEGSEEVGRESDDESSEDRDTLPSLDTLALRDALEAGLR